MRLPTLLTLALLALTAAADQSGREGIVTISCSSDERMVTTGNAATNDIKYEDMHLPETPYKPVKPSDGLEPQLQSFTKFKNSMIVDFPSEDPKQFNPALPNYYRVASKRSIIFTAVAIFFLFILFAFFYLRIFTGECGGYKTIIRKPTKIQRYSIFARISGGLLLFTIGFGITGYFSFHDRNLSMKAGNELTAANQRQLDRITQIMKDIRHINRRKFNIIYSVLSYENFQVGWFLDNIEDTYVSSRQKASEIKQILFVGTKNSVFIKFLVIIVAVIGLLIAWFFIYKNRSLTNGLLVAFLMGLVAVYMTHVLGSSFNYFSIFTEMCVESLDTFNKNKPNMRVRFDNSFQSFLTCLSPKETEMLAAQMNSLLIAENTLLIVLRNFFKTVDISQLSKFDGLESALSIKNHYSSIKARIIETTDTEGKVDMVLRQNMIRVLETANLLPAIYESASGLHNCVETKRWNELLNKDVCYKGLNYQFWALWSFSLALLGVLVMAAGFFSSENIIRGLYNEEIQYVKTNKLRYDWN